MTSQLVIFRAFLFLFFRPPDPRSEKNSHKSGLMLIYFGFSVPSDTDFDFEISVPKPPSFGSSTKVSEVIILLYILTVCPPGKFFRVFIIYRFFFKINFSEKKNSGIPSECQTDWIQTRPDVAASN